MTQTIVNPHLDRIILQETFSRILETLTPHQVLVAYLRTQGHTDAHIADLLHTDPARIAQDMSRARHRIIHLIPEASPYLRGENNIPGPHRTLNKPDPHLTPAQIALHFGVDNSTVCRWLRAGRFPNAQCSTKSGRSHWRIPPSDLKAFQPPRRGRPRNPNPLTTANYPPD